MNAACSSQPGWSSGRPLVQVGPGPTQNDAWDSQWHDASLDLALHHDLAAVDLAGLGKPIPAVELERLLVLLHD